MVQRTTVKNFYRALAASAYVAGATAAGLALGGPPGAAAAATAATANLASPLGVAAVEMVAEVGTDAALDPSKMAMGGLVTEPTFAMIGEAGPELVLPLPGLVPAVIEKRKTRKKTRRDRVLSRELKILNKRARKKDGSLRSGWTQRKIMQRAHAATSKIIGKGGTKAGQVRKTARRAFRK